MKFIIDAQLPKTLSDFLVSKGLDSILSLIDVLSLIGNPKSVPILIDLHQNYAGDLEGIAITNALKSIGTEQGYEYLAGVIKKYVNGDYEVINSRHELYIACLALKEWRNEKALEPLIQALKIEYVNLLPQTAIEALATYTKGQEYLKNNIENLQAYQKIINLKLKL